MCKSEDLPPKATRADSTVSSSDSLSDSDCSVSSLQGPYTLRKPSSSLIGAQEPSKLSSLFDSLVAVTLGCLSAAGMVGFSLWFPFVLAPQAATKTYDWAYYSYDPELSHFDNSPWTYGTDYALGVVMLGLAMTFIPCSVVGFTDKLAARSASLLLGYLVSVAAGGYAHQNYITLEERNTLSFRIMWTICVGSVTIASCAMGMSGSETIRLYQKRPTCSPLLRKLPIIPDSFWWSFGLLVTAVCAWGSISFQRPACDIFIAGITQTPSTTYFVLFLLFVQHTKVSLSTRIMGLAGFLLNVPLLPMYPLLIQYTDWSLASVNTLLHCWLCVAWSLQGVSLRNLTQALVDERKEKAAYVRMGKSL